MKTFPTLYKKTNTGALQFWNISVELGCSTPGSEFQGVIITEYGQLGTDSPQRTEDVISSGKNAGKKNATTAVEQAEAEAQAKHEKQRKKGYIDSIKAAEAEELDELIEGGVNPMLAHAFSKQGHKIKYPCYAQVKYDGIRCIAILKNGQCTLWSRTRKPITGVPHIARAIEDSFKEDIVLDGELYNHDFKKDFEKIVSFVRQEEPAKGHEVVQYHIYDVITDEPFSERLKVLSKIPFKLPILPVQTALLENEESVAPFFDWAIKEGYEGLMLRNSDGLYVNKRSYDLQKVKEFDEEEFEIVGIDEGRGKLAGHAGSFVCRTADGKEFLAKMSGETSKLREYFLNDSLWRGKLLSVQFQGLTGANGVPRFPVGKCIRDYE